MKRRVIAVLLTIVIGAALAIPAAMAAPTVKDCGKVIDGILAWKKSAEGAISAEELLNNCLAKTAGSGNAEWYAIALKRYDASVETDGYTAALYSRVKDASDLTAVDRQRVALAFSAAGGHRAYIEDTLDETVGKLGIMSCVYGLILLGSGDYDATVTSGELVDQLLSLEIEGGGWALKGTSADIDVTAMTLNSLAPYRRQAKVKAAIDRALTLLSSAQGAGGDYASWGTKNAESTAQVISALCTLGINPGKDSRFIKNGSSVIDGLLLYQKDGGGFSHILDGNVNDTAGVQAFCAFVAYQRFLSGRAALFDFTGSDKAPVTTVPKTTKKAARPTAGEMSAAGKSEAAPDASFAGATQPGTAGTALAADGTKGASAADIDSSGVVTNDDGKEVSKTSAAAGVSGSTGQTASGNEADRGGMPLYKLVLLCGIVLAASGALLWLGLKRKLNKKNALCIVLGAGVLFCAAWFLNIQTPAQYFSENTGETKPSGAYVTVEIRCDNAVGVIDSAYVPADGTILKKTDEALSDGDTVYSVLSRVAKRKRIPLDCKGSEAAGYYIKGINYLYEFDGGEFSGWVYMVNGVQGEAAASAYTLSDGDTVVWVYTVDLGRDVTAPS